MRRSKEEERKKGADVDTHTHAGLLHFPRCCRSMWVQLFPHQRLVFSLWRALWLSPPTWDNFGLKIRQRKSSTATASSLCVFRKKKTCVGWQRTAAHLRLDWKPKTSENRRRHGARQRLPFREIRRTFKRKSRPWYPSVLISQNPLIVSCRQLADDKVTDSLALRGEAVFLFFLWWERDFLKKMKKRNKALRGPTCCFVTN